LERPIPVVEDDEVEAGVIVFETNGEGEKVERDEFPFEFVGPEFDESGLRGIFRVNGVIVDGALRECEKE